MTAFGKDQFESREEEEEEEEEEKRTHTSIETQNTASQLSISRDIFISLLLFLAYENSLL